jgi:mRNA interferase MazF
MINYSNKDIWLVNFDPSFGHEFSKIRPALIVENSVFINSFELIAVVPISSQINKIFELDLILPKDKMNNLLQDSIIKTKQLNTFDKRRFIKKIGVCNDLVFSQLRLNLKLFLDL